MGRGSPCPLAVYRILGYLSNIVETDRSIKWAKQQDKVEGEKEPIIVGVDNGGDQVLV